MRRSLIHFWPLHLAVVGAAAVATAVLAGAVLIGDSMRASLRRLTLERLGGVDLALLGARPFPEELATRMAKGDGAAGFRLAPVLLLSGSALHAESGARASSVNVVGLDERFLSLFGSGAATLGELAGGNGAVPAAALNESLARELSAGIGDALVVRFEGLTEIPRGTLMGQRRPEEVVDVVRLALRTVVPDEGVGRFSLAAHQTLPRNVFVDLAELQRRLDRPLEVNALLAADLDGDLPSAPRRLVKALRTALQPADLGLRFSPLPATASPGARAVALESQAVVIPPELARAVEDAARDEGAAVQRVLTHLANRIRLADAEVPYSTVAALELPAPPFQPPSRRDGTEVRDIPDGGVLLNAWAAEDLDAEPGDQVELTYYVVTADERLETAREVLSVAGIVGLEGPGADATLTPAVPGITDSLDVRSWDLPFPLRLDAVRPRDEEYWDRFGPAPKALVSLATGRRLWASRFGALTGLRLAGDVPAEELARGIARGVAERAPLGALGLEVLPVKLDGLEAATGTTDFAGLFAGFSLFLIASSCLLVALLFRLSAELRAREIGLLLALGFPERAVRRRFLREGLVLAALGAAVGTGLSLGYARLLLEALHRLWTPLLPSPILVLEPRAGTLALAAGGALALVAAVLAATVRGLARAPARALLAGGRGEAPAPHGGGRGARRAALASGVVAAGSLAVLGTSTHPPAAAFFVAGAAGMALGLALFALWSRRPRGGLGAAGPLLLAGMAARNSARNAGRSLLALALVASATFVLAAVSASRSSGPAGHRAGPFDLVAEASLPLFTDLDDPAAGRELGLPDSVLAGVRALSLRLVPGDDASCLNLYRPRRPRLLGVTPELARQGALRFVELADPVADPWQLLERRVEDDVVPAFGDANSLRWILHLPVGGELALTDERGRPFRLRIAGALETGLFQSELLISESDLLARFPSRSGFTFFLLSTPPGRAGEVREALEAGLADFGLDVTSAAQRLEAFRQVEAVYLSTFELLGGLGLLLGTLGLGIVLVRNVLERRYELAMLLALGYRRRTLGGMVVAENLWLLGLGAGLGAVAGVLAVLPHVASAGGAVPWRTLGGTLGAVLAVGSTASLVAVAASLRRRGLARILKEE